MSVMLIFSILSCNKQENAAGDAATVSEPSAEMQMAREDKLNQAPPIQSQPQFEQKIIKNASLRFQVADYPKSINAIQNLLKNYGAFLVSSNEVRVDNSLENNLTIRVPSQNLDALVNKLAEQSIYLDYKNISSEDVTTEFVDISARLKTKKAVEQRYLDLLKQAKNVKDIIEVENQLRQIREEIESTQARINYINQQVSYSTITLQIYENSARQTGDKNFLVRILNALRNGWDLMLSFVVGLLYIWPFIILAGLALILLKKFIRKHPPVR
jgi:vacuolar-type H+-ATPase subunit D/Vma8